MFSNSCYALESNNPYGVYCKLLVDLDCIRKNLNSIKENIGQNVQLMPVVKGKAYGTYATEVLSTFTECGISMLAVAKCSEGIELRQLGFTGEIVVLSQPFIEEISNIIEYNLTPGVCYLEFLQQLEQNLKSQNKELSVHLEIETGLGRTGIDTKDLLKFVELLKNCNHIRVEGAYTHFASADSDEVYTNKQVNIFEESVRKLKEYFELKYIHMSSSAGVINVPTGICNVVRPGLLVYGYLPDESMEGKVDIHPSTKLISKISFIHKLKKGESCNYDQCFVAERDTIVGVLPIGYSIGIPRCFTGEVVINKTKVPILGRVNMDNIMVDLTDLPEVSIGQEVCFWDNEVIKLSEYAKNSKAVCEGALSVLSSQIPRVFERDLIQYIPEIGDSKRS